LSITGGHTTHIVQLNRAESGASIASLGTTVALSVQGVAPSSHTGEQCKNQS
jgi:hypothetical protein